MYKTFSRVRDLMDYRKQKDGSWTAEFRGAIDIKAKGLTLEECRSQAFDMIDEKVAALVAGRGNSAATRPRRR